MLGWQDDGTIGPNINSSVLPPKPGSIAALARQANSGGIGASLAQQKLQNRQYAKQQVQQVQPQQIAKAAPKVEVPGTGANRGAVGSLGASSGMGVAGNAEAGLLGSVNTEVQNDDNLLPYQKV
tara:strand:- start:152 stop:523 length:372 start_codon:yes stop_codon:yes gene_type:complete